MADSRNGCCEDDRGSILEELFTDVIPEGFIGLSMCQIIQSDQNL